MKTLAFFFALILPVSARIGETVDECRKRYGKEVQVDDKISAMTFKKGGFILVIAFHKGRAAVLNIRHEPKADLLGTTPELSEAELKTLLEANAGGSKWTQRKDEDFMRHTWDADPSDHLAIYNTLDRALTIITREFALKAAIEKEAEEKKKLQGF